MLSLLRGWFVESGLDAAYVEWLMLAVELLLVAVLAAVADYVVKRIIVGRVTALAERSESHWDDRVLEHGVLQRLAHVAPAIVVYLSADLVLADFAAAAALARRAALVYMIAVTTSAAFGALNAAVDIARESPIARSLPLRGIAQVVKLGLFAVAAVSVVSVILNQSPLLLLSGLGALSAVAMFVFKDAILGFVAGVQLATNRMVASGDWIEMPSHGVDGDVIEVGLATVKVQNFDKTVVTIPTYALVSESFKNWRGMSESGGRRIKRAINIDIGSVRFCDDEMLDRFARIRHVAGHVASRREEAAQANREQGVDAADYANGSRLTNAGVYRAYIVAWLRQHPMVHQDMTFLVRQLDPTEHGLPIEIYVFCRDQAWASYEAIQADIIDHLFAMAPQFDLRIYQSPSGPDVERALAVSADPPRAGVSAS